jgi:RimJ/RimL family protein N-acetyltransferase
MIRHEYQLARDDHRPSRRPLPAGVVVRRPTVEDRLALASPMMDAYVGTIDYNGETEEQAVEEVDGHFTMEAYLDASVVALFDEVIQSAVLVSRVLGVPLVEYVMTRVATKGQGLASALLDISIAAVWDSRAEELRAFITKGNTPSEKVFERVGFKVIATYGED